MYITSYFGMVNYPVLVSDINENNFVFEYTPNQGDKMFKPMNRFLHQKSKKNIWIKAVGMFTKYR